VLLLKQAKAAGSVTVARTTAAFSSWLTSNTTHGSGGSAATGDGSDTVTDGSTTVLTKVKINTAMKNAFAATSELPTKLICGPFNKTKISAFDESGTNMRRMVDSNTVGSSVEIIESDFGALEILPDNFGRERDVHLINPDYITISYLRNWEMRSIASQGDVSDTRAIYVEFGAQVDNEAAHAAVYDNTVS
jgi:hypothetical protein